MKKTTKKTVTNKLKGKLLVIDGHNLLHRSFHKFANMRTREGRPTGAIFGFFKSLTPLLYKYKPSRVIVVFDGDSRSKFRYKLHGEYKAGRVKLGGEKQSMMKQLKAIKKILKYLGIDCINDRKLVNDWEADDYITYLVMNSPFKKNVILSSDKDFNQLLDNNTVIYNPNPKISQLVTVENVLSLFGYEASQTVDYLTLLGDVSDNIKGIPGYGEKKSKELLKKYHSLDMAIAKGGLVLPKAFPDDCDIMELILRNKQLIDTKLHVTISRPFNGVLPIEISSKNNIDKKRLFPIIEKYALNSFLKPEFLDAYKQYNKFKTSWKKLESCWQGQAE